MRTASALVVMALLAAPAAFAEEPSNPLPTTEESTARQLEELDQKLKILERKAELEREQAAEKAKTAASAAAGKDGFALKSADGAFQLKLRGYIHVDGRAFLDDEERPATDTFIVRRARPIVEGTLFSRFDFRIMPDFGGGTTVLQDATIDLRFSPAVKVRAGKFKPPVGLERLQSATDLLFIERSLPTNLVPNRDLGVQLFGDLAQERVSWAVGAFNGVVDGGSGDGDNNDGKDLAARLFLQPWVQHKGAALSGLGFGLAASTGKQEGTLAAPSLPTFRSAGQQAFFSYRSDATAAGTTVADGERTRLAPQLTFTSGPFGLLAEDVRSTQEVRRGTTGAKLTHQARQLTLSWVLAGGGKASYKGVTPKKVFDPKAKTWGAFELVARGGELELDSDTFPFFANPASSAEKASEIGIGFNWYLSKGVRVLVDYNVTRFEGGAASGDRPEEKALFTRLQLAY